MRLIYLYKSLFGFLFDRVCVVVEFHSPDKYYFFLSDDVFNSFNKKNKQKNATNNEIILFTIEIALLEMES